MIPIAHSALPRRVALAFRRLRPGKQFRKQVAEARREPDEFIRFCFTDPAGLPLRQGRIHFELQEFLTGQRKALVELPRDHGKSVQICARILWELGRDPSLRVKVVCSSEAVAAERGRFMKEAIENNGLLRIVFPGVRPADPWSATRFSVRRPANVIGPSVTAIGVGATLTGTRADLLVCDDIVDVKSIASRAERERIKAYFRDNLMNLLEPDGRCWCLFTPWHSDDLNSELKRNEAFIRFRRAIDETLTPVWPERWSRARLEERRKEIGAASFARGYRLIPLAPEEVPIRAEWVRFWIEDRTLAGASGSEEMGSERIVLSVDPAVSAKERADASALVVLGRSNINEIRCLEAIARRVNAPELVHLIDDAERRWNPDAILFEDNAGFKGIKDLLVRHARFGPKIKGVTQSREKAARVGAFSVQIENGTFLLKGAREGGVDPSQLGLFEEMTTFPCGEHDDLLDAAATGAAYLLEKREPRVWAP
jgi:predicted phage terminase large subunit-like protein